MNQIKQRYTCQVCSKVVKQEEIIEVVQADYSSRYRCPDCVDIKTSSAKEYGTLYFMLVMLLLIGAAIGFGIGFKLR